MEQEKVDVSLFDFNDFKAYLIKKGLPNGLYAHTSRNLNTWAKRLGYKSPSSLSMILTGERLPSDEMVEKLSVDLKMSGREKRYFKLLVDLEKKKKKNQDTTEVLKSIQKASTEKNSFAIDLNVFSTISEWHYLAIKQLITTESFVEDENWIYRRLRKKVTVGQIRIAMKNLTDLGIIGHDETGRLRVLKPGLITTNDVPSSAIKKHHLGMLELALQALVEQTVEERQINSTTLKVKNSDLPEAKKFIFDFIKEFANRFYTEATDDVYQLNVQFFELTKNLNDIQTGKNQ